MKKKIESASIIMKSYRKYKFRKQIFTKLKILVKRIRLWKKIAKDYSFKIKK